MWTKIKGLASGFKVSPLSKLFYIPLVPEVLMLPNRN